MDTVISLMKIKAQKPRFCAGFFMDLKSECGTVTLALVTVTRYKTALQDKRSGYKGMPGPLYKTSTSPSWCKIEGDGNAQTEVEKRCQKALSDDRIR